MKVSRRCYMHHENNCQHGFCVVEEQLNAANPERHKPAVTDGAPETSWAHPWNKELELAQLKAQRSGV